MLQEKNLQAFEDTVTSIIVICNSAVLEEHSEEYRRKESLKKVFSTFKTELDNLESSIDLLVQKI